MDKYSQIKSTINDELIRLEENLENIFSEENPLFEYLKTKSDAKRLRPIISILLYKALTNKELTNADIETISAIEIIHNASLIHDDIIDNSEKRRNKPTVNKEFGDKLAVIAGDFLLSAALEKLTFSTPLLKECSTVIKKLCLGEINQYYSKKEIPSLENYLNKTENKTASLFELAASALFIANEEKEETVNLAKDIGKSFGIAYQIRDDYINFKNEKDNENSDFYNGIYTAPVILSDIKEINYNKIANSDGLAKTLDLIDTYFSETLASIEKIKNNKYKEALTSLITKLKEES